MLKLYFAKMIIIVQKSTLISLFTLTVKITQININDIRGFGVLGFWG